MRSFRLAASLGQTRHKETGRTPGCRCAMVRAGQRAVEWQRIQPRQAPYPHLSVGRRRWGADDLPPNLSRRLESLRAESVLATLGLDDRAACRPGEWRTRDREEVGERCGEAAAREPDTGDGDKLDDRAGEETQGMLLARQSRRMPGCTTDGVHWPVQRRVTALPIVEPGKSQGSRSPLREARLENAPKIPARVCGKECERNQRTEAVQSRRGSRKRATSTPDLPELRRRSLSE